MVLDWGCAKKLGSPPEFLPPAAEEEEELVQALGVPLPTSHMTVSGSVMGTIAFMSPEQAAGDNDRVGISSDIYGLGATLFNILTNEVIFDCRDTSQDSIEKALDQVQRGQHRGIHDVDPRIPKPLAAICTKAIAHEPENRYATAGALGQDIDAFLAGEKVSAYQDSFADKAVRYVRQNRTTFAALMGTLLVGFVSLAAFALMVNHQRDKLSATNSKLAQANGQLSNAVKTEQKLTAQATLREELAKQKLYETEMLLASEASTQPGGIGRMRQLVDRWRDPGDLSIPGWEWQHLNAVGNREFWKLDLESTANRILYTRDNPAARVFDASKNTLIRLDTDAKRVIDQLQLPANTTVVDLSRDQSLLAVGLDDGSVQVWQLNDPAAEPVVFNDLDSSVNDIRWNIGGDFFAACDSTGNVTVWQWFEREAKYSDESVLTQSGKQLLDWSYDGFRLCWTTGTKIVELNTKDYEKQIVATDDFIVNPCTSHEGKLLAWIGARNSIVVKDSTSEKISRFTGHQLFIESLQWHPSRHYLLSSSADGSVRVWNTDTEKEVRQLLGHGGHVYSASWNSTGTKVASGGLPDDKLRVWDLADLGTKLDRELQNHPAFAWHPDGSYLAVAEGTDIVVQYDSKEVRLLQDTESAQPEIFGLALDQSGKRIACVAANGRIWTVDGYTGKLLKVLDQGSNENLFPDITSKAIAWSPDGKYLAGIGSGGKLRVWEESSGEDIAQPISIGGKPLVVSWRPKSDDGSNQLAIAGTGQKILVFDPAKREIVKDLTQYGWNTGLAWSPDGQKIAVSERRGIDIWDVNKAKKVGRCEGPSSMIQDLDWSSSTGRIAGLAEDGMVCIWNDETWAYCARFGVHQEFPYAIRWSPDGTRISSTSRHGRIVFQATSKSNGAANQ